MNTVNKGWLMLIAAFPGSLAAQLPEGIEIANWYGFKKAAITYTFDDLTPKQLPVAVPLFEKYGFTATLYPVVNWNPDWKALQEVADKGFEIGSHSLSHPNLASLPVAEQERELTGSRDSIDAHLRNHKCLSVAYPYCVTGDISIAIKNYFAARICSNQVEPATPGDFYRISSIIVGSEWPVNNAAELNKKVMEAEATGGWCVFLLHGIDDDGGYSAFSSDELRKHFDYIKANPEEFWVVPFSDAVKYIRERNSLKVTIKQQSRRRIRLDIKDTLSNSIYNQAVTMRVCIPANWDRVSIWQNGKEITTFQPKQEAEKKVIFNMVPDEGEVSIIRIKTRKAATTGSTQ
ncbi:MAG: polysaccharide deacetylase family protein [Bacteroidales bacterium]